MLKGEKVVLRAMKKTDFALFPGWFNNLEIGQNLGMYKPISEVAHEHRMQEMGNRPEDSRVVFTIEINDQGVPTPVGQCGLTDINHKDRNAELYVVIGEKKHWGNGYGMESVQLILDYGFNQMNLHRIASHVLAFNQRSLALHRKMGFVQEALYRQSFFKDGQFWDVFNFAMLREEWKNVKG